MPRPLRLRCHDIPVVLQLVLTPESSYPAISAAVGISVGEGHNAVKRLQSARLLGSGSRTVEKRQLLDFLVHGVPFAFPACPGMECVGIPTAFDGPLLVDAPELRLGPDLRGSSELRRGGVEPGGSDAPGADAVAVWPFPGGGARGRAVAPLCPEAPGFVESNPRLYRWLTLVDALRLGLPRGRHALERILRREIHEQAGALH